RRSPSLARSCARTASAPPRRRVNQSHPAISRRMRSRNSALASMLTPHDTREAWMTVDLERVTVEDEPARSRWVAHAGEVRAFANYMRDGDTITFTHTFVPPELEGQGVGQKLVR